MPLGLGASVRVGGDGADSGRGGALSRLVGGRESEEPVKQRIKAGHHDDQRKNNSSPLVSYQPGSLEATPILSFFAIEGWACSSVRFNLRIEERA